MKLNMKVVRLLSVCGALGLTLLAYQNCSQYELTSTVSKAEREVILEVPFEPHNPRSNIGGTSDAGDSTQPSFPYAAQVGNDFVSRCTQARYEQEKAEVLNMASNDTSNTLIPVRFSISSGNAIDETAYMAYVRSILRSNDDGLTDVYVGPADKHIYRDSHAGVFHYVADHTEARERYIKGERCFFDVIRVVGGHAREVRLNGTYNHTWAILNYGNIYSGQNSDSYELSPRLFKRIEQQSTPQIIPLYVADIREPYFSFTNSNYKILNPEFSSSAVRSKEYAVQLRELFFLDRMFKHRDQFVADLSTSKTVGGYNFAPYEGIPQLFDNIIFGYNATILSMQYTPIVIDLGEKHIRTSSLDWGSFFNLSNLPVPENNKGYKRISHQVAWLGGHLRQVNENGKQVWKRIADDGFLVLPDSNNEVHSAEQMFSNRTVVNGRRYNNGFDALAAYANKNCLSESTEEKYIGPWDEAYNTLKVWVDANRNGHVDSGELFSLKDKGIVALNPCSFNHEVSVDQYNNRTSIRSSVLIAEDLASGNLDETEIKNRLFSGKTASGADADFRVMIDIYFRSRPSFFLENINVVDGGGDINNY